MNRCLNQKAGFSLVSVMVSIGLAGGLLMVLLRASASNKVISDSSKTMEIRAELFRSLQTLSAKVDCSSTISSFKSDNPNLQDIPQDGMPVKLLRYPSSEVIVDLNGSRYGRFSYVADIMPGNSIKLRFAAFKNEQSSPRSHLKSGSDSLFQTTEKTVWNFDNSAELADKYFPSYINLCEGQAVASIGGDALSTHFQVHTAGMTVTVLNKLTGHVCSFSVSLNSVADWNLYSQTTFTHKTREGKDPGYYKCADQLLKGP